MPLVRRSGVVSDQDSKTQIGGTPDDPDGNQTERWRRRLPTEHRGRHDSHDHRVVTRRPRAHCCRPFSVRPPMGGAPTPIAQVPTARSRATG